MEKRLVVFIVLALAVWVGYMALQAWLLPPRPAIEEVVFDPAGEKPPENETSGEQKKPSVDQPPAPEVEIDEPPAPPIEGAAVSPPTKAAIEAPAAPPEPARWLTLGSLDPKSPHRLLATLSSEGASLERLELNSSSYRDLEGKHGSLGHRGYLGHLALTPESGGGCKVNAVGAGVPAGELRVGDVLLRAGKREINSELDLEDALDATRPGEKIELKARRVEGAIPVEKTFTVTLARKPLQLVRPERSNRLHTEPAPRSLLLTLQTRTEHDAPSVAALRERHWKVTRANDTTVEFLTRLEDADLGGIGLKGPLEVVKRYRLADVGGDATKKAVARDAHLTLDIEVRNLSGAAQQVYYRLDGPNGLPAEGWWYSNKIHPGWSGGGARDVVYKTSAGGQRWSTAASVFSHVTSEETPLNLFLASAQTPPEQRALEYIAVDHQYFAVALSPVALEGSPSANGAAAGEGTDPASAAGGVAQPTVFTRADALLASAVDVQFKADSHRANTTFRLVSQVCKLAAAPGASGAAPEAAAAGEESKAAHVAAARFVVFAGPKEPELLAEYGLDQLNYYGWFGWITVPLLWILHGFYAVLPNYGVAIILLTVLVRGCMYPIGRQAARNAQKMQELAPEMKQIAEKFKNDMQKRGEAQQSLFRKHNYNPLGGCLLMFLQLPIFVGLYRALAVDINLRDQALLPGLDWCSNLSGPDQLLYWGLAPSFLFDYTGWLGPYLNVLPLATVALFLVQQKMFTPPPTDEQTRMQHQMMTFMTFFIGLMFFKVPSGLCIYFIVSSLWSVAERKLLGTSSAKTAGDKPAETPPAKKIEPPAKKATEAEAEADTGAGSLGKSLASLWRQASKAIREQGAPPKHAARGKDRRKRRDR